MRFGFYAANSGCLKCAEGSFVSGYLKRAGFGGSARTCLTDDELAGHVVVARSVAASESFAGALGEIVSPFGHGLAGARAAQRGGGGDSQYRGKHVASALAAAGVVDAGEEFGQVLATNRTVRLFS